MDKKQWEAKFLQKISLVHKRNRQQIVKRVLKKIDGVKNSLPSRSRKHNVVCKITLDELRQLVYDTYGTKCRYCHKIITVQTMVVDHIIPMSKSGPSTIENLQVICRTSNSMKGSLSEEHFDILLNWLDIIPDELKKDISIRLSRGIH